MGPPTARHRPYAAEHKNPKGPGDSRPTALQIVEREGLIGTLDDKTMMVTGCTAGLGIETARALHATGAKLFLTVRDRAKGEAVIEDIVKTSTGNVAIELLLVDLSDLSSVRRAASDFLSRSETLHVLVENAGVMFPAERYTVDGFETYVRPMSRTITPRDTTWLSRGVSGVLRQSLIFLSINLDTSVSITLASSSCSSCSNQRC